MVEFRKGSNCMAKFQFSEYGTLPTVGSVKSTATPGIANELKKTNPFASVPSKVSSGVLDPCNALFPVKRIGDVLSTPIRFTGNNALQGSSTPLDTLLG